MNWVKKNLFLWGLVLTSNIITSVCFSVSLHDELNVAAMDRREALRLKQETTDELEAFRGSATTLFTEFNQDKELLRQMMFDMQGRLEETHLLAESIYDDLDFINEVAISRTRKRMTHIEDDLAKKDREIEILFKTLFPQQTGVDWSKSK